MEKIMRFTFNLFRFLIVIFFSLTCSLQAQDEPGLDVSKNDVAEFGSSPGDKAREWLEKRCEDPNRRCLEEGFNDPIKEGQSTVYVAIGTGSAAMPNKSQNIHNSRQAAFDKAMLNAKADFARALGSNIAASMRASVTQNTMPDPDPTKMVKESVKKSTGAVADMSAMEKFTTLINLKLNKQLKQNGYDENAAIEEKRKIIQKVIESDVFESNIKQTSQAAISGFQSWKTFEKSVEGDKIEMQVVGIWSSKLAQLAAHIKKYNPETFPIKKEKTRKIKDQLPLKNAGALRSTFGARMYYNELGEMEVVSFGHAAPIKEGKKRLLSNACKIARTKANANLTLFVNETIYFTDNFYEKDAAGTLLVDGKEEEFDFNGQDWKETIESIGTLENTKITPIARKVVKPDSHFNASDCIVVVSWSPKNQRGRKAVEDANKQGTGTSTENGEVNEKYESEGAEGSSDF